MENICITFTSVENPFVIIQKYNVYDQRINRKRDYYYELRKNYRMKSPFITDFTSGVRENLLSEYTQLPLSLWIIILYEKHL